MIGLEHSVKGAQSRVRVWDSPVRLFHWGLVGCFITAWLTRDSRYLDVHVFSGYVMAGLLLFRVVWGLVGEPYARFSSFGFGWSAVRDYLQALLQRRPIHFIGHNPAGSWAIYLILTLGLMIAFSGLLTLGGEERHGPLAGWLNFSQGAFAHEVHEWLAWFLLGLVVVHLMGVLVESLLHRENLVAAMLTGYKRTASKAVATRSRLPIASLMLVLILASGAAWFRGYLVQTPEQPYLPFTGPELPDDPLWREECGSCHLAFHPSLLPVRSWQRLMREQGAHFGEDLALDAETVQAIESFLTANASEQAPTEAAWQINRSIAPEASPLSITQTPYWREKHQELSDAIWKSAAVKGKSNCGACHLDADAGTFQDAAMRIPGDP